MEKEQSKSAERGREHMDGGIASEPITSDQAARHTGFWRGLNRDNEVDG